MTICPRSAGSISRARAPTPRLPPKPAAPGRICTPVLNAFAPRSGLYPLFSSRWDDVFGYGQIKTESDQEAPVSSLRAVRFVGDARRTTGGVSPQAFPKALSSSAPASRPTRGTARWPGLKRKFDRLSDRDRLTDYTRRHFLLHEHAEHRSPPNTAAGFLKPSATASSSATSTTI